MKKILFFALLFVAPIINSCSDDDNTFPETKTRTISFEPSEELIDPDGELVILGDAVVGGYSPGTFSNVYWAKGREFNAESSWGSQEYRGLLCTSSDGNVKFNTLYTDGDSWGAFTLSQNYNNSAKDYNLGRDQFFAWTTSGANDTDTYAVVYDSYDAQYSAFEYLRPSIELNNYTVDNLYIANSTVTHSYSSPLKDFFFTVTIEGYDSNGDKVGSKSVDLIKGGVKVSDWVKVSLAGFGSVNKIKFVVSSSDTMAPKYFCIDEITIVE